MSLKAVIKSHWLLIAISLFYLVLSAVTFHKDLFYVALFSSKLVSGDLNMYKITNTLGTGQINPYIIPVAPPFAQLLDSLLYALFYFLGIYRFALIPLEPLIFNHQSVPLPIPMLSLLLKLRYFIPFFLSIFLVKKIALRYEPNSSLQKTIVALWLLCPVLAYSTFMQGNNDLYPVIFLLLFLLFSLRKQNFWALVFLGLAAATKNFAVFLFIPAAIILAKREFKKTLAFISLPSLIYGAQALFYWQSSYHFFTAGKESFYILKSILPNNYLLFPFAYFLIIGYLLFMEKQQNLTNNTIRTLLLYCFFTLSLFFTTSLFPPQWFLWIMPFFILLIYNNSQLLVLYILIVTAFFFTLLVVPYWSGNVDYSLFSYTFPILQHIEPFAKTIGSRFEDLRFAQLANTLFEALYILFILVLIKQRPAAKLLPKPKLIYLSFVPLFVFFALNLAYVLFFVIKTNTY